MNVDNVKMSTNSMQTDEEFGDAPTPEITTKEELLFLFVDNGDLEEFKLYHKDYDLQNDRDEHMDNYLHRAARRCLNKSSYDSQEPMLKFLLSEAPELCEEKNSAGETALCLACKIMLHYELIPLLLRCNPRSVNIADNNGLTPLHHLSNFIRNPWIESRDVATKAVVALETSMLFIKHKANVNAETKEGKNILQNYLDKEPHIHLNLAHEFIPLLLKNGTKLCSSSGIHALAYVKTLQEAKLIIEFDKNDINKLDNNNWTPLHHLIIQNGGLDNSIIIYLIENGAEIEEGTDIIMLAREHELEYYLIEFLLQQNPTYNVNKRDKWGRTLLIQYGITIEVIQKLLDLGADISMCDLTGMNVLMLNCSLSYVDPQTIEYLLKNGASPYLTSSYVDNILPRICKFCFKSKGETYNNWLNLLKYLVQLPELNDDTMPEQLVNLYGGMVRIIFFEFNWEKYKHNMLDILTVLFTSLKKINSFLIKVNNMEVEHLIFKLPSIKPISFAISMLMCTLTNTVQTDVELFIKKVLDSGFSLAENSRKCVTPFTSFLLSLTDFQLNTKLENNIFLLFFNSDVNIESYALKIHSLSIPLSNSIEYLHTLQAVKYEFKISDVLLLSFLNDRKKYVGMLLEFWWGPPLVLLLFKAVPGFYCLKSWLPLLLKYGGIPHGTELFKIFKSHMDSSDVNTEIAEVFLSANPDFRPHWDTYQQYLRSPLKLQDLCKYAVRQSLAKRASQPGTSLPTLIQETLPALLRPAVLHNVQPDKVT